MQSLEEMRGREQLPRCRGDIRLALPRQTASSFDIWIEAGAPEPAWTVHTTISHNHILRGPGIHLSKIKVISK